MPTASAARSTGSKWPCRPSHSSLPRPNASAVPAAAARSRSAIVSAVVSANDRLACSSRSPRTRPTCQARTRGGGNDPSESLACASEVAAPIASVSRAGALAAGESAGPACGVRGDNATKARHAIAIARGCEC